VGCLREPGGSAYNGSASRGESNRRCLRWDTPGLREIFPGQMGWSHNYCRNPDGAEESPICYTSEEEYDYCSVPDCAELGRRETERARLPDVCRHLTELDELHRTDPFANGYVIS
jgi:hypothetical protein